MRLVAILRRLPQMIAPALVFLVALGSGLYWGRPALRALVALAIILSPLRGGLLALANDVGIGDSDLAVNALVPALVAALAIGVAFRLRPGLQTISKPLLVGWSLIVCMAIVSFFVQTVGFKLYGIGVAQYLVYPTLAIAAWPLLKPGDLRKLSRLSIVMGLVVAVTVLVQATGVESFIQSAGAEVDGLAANRYAGITGSYLHTSAYLGIAAVLLMGELLQLSSLRRMAGGTALLGVILCGQILTFSRSGVVIAGLGAAALLLFAARHRRLAFLSMLGPAIGVALVVGAIGGVSPDAAGARVGSGFDPTGDEGNSLRSRAFSQGLTRFREADPLNQLLGEGLAATGNARRLASGEVITVESYYLKLLLEVGVLGVVLIGGFLIWATVFFIRRIWDRRSPWPASIAASGLGLSLYNVIYPALETQILALTWWLLLALCLRYEVDAPTTSEVREESVALSGRSLLEVR